MSFASRISRLTSWITDERLSAALFVDVEGRRDLSIRYLTGHPGDALLFVLADGRSILIPWDINLARTVATADRMVPYSDYDRSLTRAVASLAAEYQLKGRVEVSAATPYPIVEELTRAAAGCEIVCRPDGLDEIMRIHRMVKDGEELKRIDRAAQITNELLRLLEEMLTDTREATEVEIAQFLEREALERGCEGMSFDSLVAGPARSYGIHAFPPYSAGTFANRGMSILDFGVLVEGYPSDVTITVVAGATSRKQEEMIALVEKAYDRAASLAEPGVQTREIARAVDEIFAERGYTMPHSLGHGLGLEVHEKPYLRNKSDVRTQLEVGMVFTIEPGLYDPEAGGVRLENDFLVTEEGTKVLTTSRILRLP